MAGANIQLCRSIGKDTWTFATMPAGVLGKNSILGVLQESRR
jgi:hypothetical protein